MLDGFSFTTLTRRLAEIYSALSAGEAVPPSPFGPVSAVIDERRTYENSDAFASTAETYIKVKVTVPHGAIRMSNYSASRQFVTSKCTFFHSSSSILEKLAY